MGSITRSFANNITTSGVLLPASLTNDSIANVTAYNASIATGGMVLVSSATASASATIDFTLGSYKEYQFYFVNCHPSATSNPLFQTSTDNGSTYGVTATTTSFGPYHTETDASDFGYETAADVAQSTSFFRLNPWQTTGTADDEHFSGSLTIYNPSSTTYVKHFTSRIISISSGVQPDCFVAGYFNTTSALTNARFKMSSGNIDEGTILMYGIV
jgi:hypothetical protein